ncbi:MAG TPA: nitronate monooxygenase family protein [Pseudorhodoferax sp.]|nr:nitronate monooxygenase family protein [Pseudorhodoferax sp.]
MRTRLTDLLGIRHPIVEGGMQWVGRAELAAAVSNAGALGMISARTQPDPQALLREITRARALTQAPFGVNLSLPLIGAALEHTPWVDAIVQGGVRVVETAGNKPHAVIAALKAHRVTVIHKCTSLRHALSAERIGADIVSIDGFEAAGHIGEDDVGSMVLVPLVRRQLRIPVIASGGIADGAGMAAALALGADGVNLGTRFMLTRESPVHDALKRAMLASDVCATLLIKRSLRRTGRFFRNAVSEQILARENRPGGTSHEELRGLLSAAGAAQAYGDGLVDAGVVCASQVVGLVNDMPSCAELVARMATECRAALEAARALAA